MQGTDRPRRPQESVFNSFDLQAFETTLFTSYKLAYCPAREVLRSFQEESRLPLNRDVLWYKDAIIYQVHVRTFYDSNGDGIGDFQGLEAEARLPAGTGRSTRYG